MHPDIYAHGRDEGFKFILPPSRESLRPNLSNTDTPPSEADFIPSKGGILRREDQGHFVTIVGRGGTGKTLLALQLMTQLLSDAKQKYEQWPQGRPHGAFYFTLEATPFEIYNQLIQFSWGKNFAHDKPEMDVDRWDYLGLHVVSIPSPAEDLNALLLHVKQTIARELNNIGRLVAIGIDPLGGVYLGVDLRSELSRLKHLATSHRTFVFLLTEDHIFEQRRSVEHYSQTIVHLRHDPGDQPYRRLYIQKSRSQRFRSGFHQFELDPEFGVKVFPSVQAQSAFAHDEIEKKVLKVDNISDTPAPRPLFDMEGEPIFDEEIMPGSVIFLMGPPGTFKQVIATNFVKAITDNLGLYISFKADIEAVKTTIGSNFGREAETKVVPLSSKENLDDSNKPPGGTLFLDARNPLATPQEILSQVREAVIHRDERFSRAVVWGLRRLNDMPNFAGGMAVQFLEALVTLLKSRNITSLLVDWPDIEKASTLPIVDLSQYILLTRVCRGLESVELKEKDDEALRNDLDGIWQHEQGRAEHVALLRLQRTAKGFHRNLGVAFRRTGDSVQSHKLAPNDFERFWSKIGIAWEKDPGLVH